MELKPSDVVAPHPDAMDAEVDKDSGSSVGVEISRDDARNVHGMQMKPTRVVEPDPDARSLKVDNCVRLAIAIDVAAREDIGALNPYGGDELRHAASAGGAEDTGANVAPGRSGRAPSVNKHVEVLNAWRVDEDVAGNIKTVWCRTPITCRLP